MSDPTRDPKAAIADALQAIREGLNNLRESVVLLVMRRNKIQSEVARLERLLADVDEKAARAEQLNNPHIAADLRNERTLLAGELERNKTLLAQAEAEAEAAKMRMPDEEQRLMQQATDLQAQLNRLTSERVVSGAVYAESDTAWERAVGKVENLQNESSARAEVAGSGSSGTSGSGLPQMPSEESAEKMLSELEARTGPPAVAPDPPARSDFLEFDVAATPPLHPVAPPAPDREQETGNREQDDSDRIRESTPLSEPAPETPEVVQETITVPTIELSPSASWPPVLNIPEGTPEDLVASSAPTPASEPEAAQTTAAPFAVAAELEPTAEEETRTEREPVAETDIPTEAKSAAQTEPMAETEMIVTAELDPEPTRMPEPQAENIPEPEPQAETAPEPEPTTEAAEVSASELETPALPSDFHIAVQPQSESKTMPSMGRVRVAAIGTGGIFRGAHLPCYPDIAQAQLVAICDPDKKAQELTLARLQALVQKKVTLAKETGDTETADRVQRDLDEIKIYEDISQVIAEIKPDLVDICTQPLLHAPLSIQALEAGIHVMCEKPISRSWLESQRLIETVERTGKFYQHNENWLFDKDYYTAKKLVDAGSIGEPILMFLATAHGGPEGNPKFWDSDFGGGGALLDNGIHAIGASWYISGLEKKPTLVKTAEPFGMTIRMPNRIIEGRYQKVTVDDDAHILIRFENPDTHAWTTAHVEGSWSYRDSPDTCIIGTTGKILFEDKDGRRFAVVIDSYDREQRRIEVSGSNWQHWPSSFYGEISNMVECVRNGVPSLMTAYFGADCSAVVGAAYLSQARNKAGVTLDEFKAFAGEIASRYPGDTKAQDDALVEALLKAVRG